MSKFVKTQSASLGLSRRPSSRDTSQQSKALALNLSNKHNKISSSDASLRFSVRHMGKAEESSALIQTEISQLLDALPGVVGALKMNYADFDDYPATNLLCQRFQDGLVPHLHLVNG